MVIVVMQIVILLIVVMLSIVAPCQGQTLKLITDVKSFITMAQGWARGLGALMLGEEIIPESDVRLGFINGLHSFSKDAFHGVFNDVL